MIRRSRAQSSSLFLMELILAILFFSITSAVCVQFFVKSHLLSRSSDALNYAANECASVAELLDTANSISDCPELLQQLYPDDFTYDGGPRDIASDSELEDIALNDAGYADAEFDLGYNEDFLPCGEEEPVYTLHLHIEQTGRILTANMKFCWEDSEVVYELNTKHHIARRTGYEKR